MKRKLFVMLVLSLVMFSFLTGTASAAPYKSYVYDSQGVVNESPDAFDFEKSIYLQDMVDSKGQPLESMNEPSDLFIDHNHNIYISDTGNNRIVVLNPDFTFQKVIDTFLNDGMEDMFMEPNGIFVDSRDSSIYICDSGNGRVVHLDKTGKLMRIIAEGVTSPILPDSFTFTPLKISVDSAGRIFVVCKDFTMGIIEIDREGEFVQCLGAPKVTYNIIELIWRAISTEEQRSRMESFIPTEYNNITVDSEDFLYVTNDIFDKTTAADTDMVKRLNAKGSDVLRKVENGVPPYGDTDIAWVGTYRGPSKLRDVITLDYGVYAVLDYNRSRVFFYNSDGVNLFEFGSPPDNRDSVHMTYTNGNLSQPVSIGWLDGRCLVLDHDYNAICIFRITEYGSKVMEATRLHYEDEYDAEAKLWEEILVLNNNSSAARLSLGKVAYRNQDWDAAMQYFKDTYDAQNYSKAYKFARSQLISDYFSVGAIVFVAAIVLIIVLKKLRKKYLPPIREDSYFGKLKYAKRVIFRPLNSYWSLTRENKGSVAAAFTIMCGAALAKLLQARFTGFAFNPMAEYTNIFMQILTVIAPLMLFCVCNWCVTSLLGGEGSFKAIYISSCYALTPMIILYPIAMILSNVMVLDEGNFYTVFVSIALFWVFLLIFSAVMRVHDYTLGQTVGIMLLTIVVMLLVVFLGVLFFALCQQMYGFIRDLATELSTR